MCAGYQVEALHWLTTASQGTIRNVSVAITSLQCRFTIVNEVDMMER